MSDDKYINVRTTVSTTATDIDVLVEYVPADYWILTTGYWDNEGIWINDALWIN
jgi:hypothetical protein